MLTPREKLNHLIGYLGFGYIQHLHIKGGEPVFNPPPKVVHHQVLARRKPAPMFSRRQIQAFEHLYAAMEQIGNGTIANLEIHNFCPRLLEITEGPPPADAGSPLIP